MIRKTVKYTGHVQGVGFRYSTTNIAARFLVAGYVQNMPDGSVRLVAEGEKTEVDAFLDAVMDQLARHIKNHYVEAGEATGEFGDPASEDTFAVRY